MIEPWQVWLADLDPAEGHEQAGVRPVVVVSSHVHLRATQGRLVTVSPLTGQNRRVRGHVEVENHRGDPTWVMADQIRTLSSLRFERSHPWWSLRGPEISRVVEVLAHMVDF